MRREGERGEIDGERGERGERGEERKVTFLGGISAEK